MDNYTLWTKHNEPRVLMEDDEDADDDNNIPDFSHLYEAGVGVLPPRPPRDVPRW
jgi:hypothetical protein